MRVLVIGASGQVGRRVCTAALAGSHRVFGTYRSRRPTLPAESIALLDKRDRTQMDAVVQRFRPELIIDTGALHQVDYCEQHPAEAHEVNADGTRAIAEAAMKLSARFVFVSTDFVFGNGGEPPRVEEEEPSPLSVYGESKRAGELAALEACREAVVARPSVIFGWNDPAGPSSSSGKSLDFASWVVDQLRRGEPLRIVNDQIASPTYADDLALALLRLGESSRTGVYHTAGATAVSRHAFAVRIARETGFDVSSIRAIATSELHQLARRPSDSSLDSSKLARDLGYQTLGLDESLPKFAAEFRSRAV
jgi:dTDP-4-dehydrorhamnose reductase